jgi:hypothetical protein
MKFRVWNNKTNHYDIRCLLLSSTGELYSWNEKGNIEHLPIQTDYEVELYTGINDVKGRPVFVNDIVKCIGRNEDDDCDTCPFYNTTTGQQVGLETFPYPLPNCDRFIKIVGNAHITETLNKGDTVKIRETGEIRKIEFYEDVFENGDTKRYYLLNSHTERFSESELLKIKENKND